MQVTIPVFSMQPGAATNVTPEGSVSVTSIEVPVTAPLFVTTSVKIRSRPAVADPGIAVCVMARSFGVGAAKDAVTLRAAVMETLQLPVPVHAPPQPPNTMPASGVAVSDTDVP